MRFLLLIFANHFYEKRLCFWSHIIRTKTFCVCFDCSCTLECYHPATSPMKHLNVEQPPKPDVNNQEQNHLCCSCFSSVDILGRRKSLKVFMGCGRLVFLEGRSSFYSVGCLFLLKTYKLIVQCDAIPSRDTTLPQGITK